MPIPPARMSTRWCWSIASLCRATSRRRRCNNDAQSRGLPPRPRKGAGLSFGSGRLLAAEEVLQQRRQRIDLLLLLLLLLAALLLLLLAAAEQLLQGISLLLIVLLVVLLEGGAAGADIRRIDRPLQIDRHDWLLPLRLIDVAQHRHRPRRQVDLAMEEGASLRVARRRVLGREHAAIDGEIPGQVVRMANEHIDQRGEGAGDAAHRRELLAQEIEHGGARCLL